MRVHTSGRDVLCRFFFRTVRMELLESKIRKL